MKTSNSLSYCMLFSSVLWTAGCGGPDQGSANSASSMTADEHNHPTEGPHHGGLIELGNEEYHAELVHDDATGNVTVFILDGVAKQAVPIDATELSINLSHEGTAEQFALTANPDVNDPAGKSSRFSSNDAELAEELDHEGTAQLVVTIRGKQFRGKIVHHDDHEGHEH